MGDWRERVVVAVRGVGSKRVGGKKKHRKRERALREMKLLGGMAVRAETARLTDGPECSLLIL